MTERRVTLKLNQQQTELLEKTVARGEAKDMASLVRRALREFAKAHPAPSSQAGRA